MLHTSIWEERRWPAERAMKHPTTLSDCTTVFLLWFCNYSSFWLYNCSFYDCQACQKKSRPVFNCKCKCYSATTLHTSCNIWSSQYKGKSWDSPSPGILSSVVTLYHISRVSSTDFLFFVWFFLFCFLSFSTMFCPFKSIFVGALFSFTSILDQTPHCILWLGNFTIYTNIFCNVDKYICNLDKYICNLDKYI